MKKIISNPVLTFMLIVVISFTVVNAVGRIIAFLFTGSLIIPNSGAEGAIVFMSVITTIVMAVIHFTDITKK